MPHPAMALADPPPDVAPDADDRVTLDPSRPLDLNQALALGDELSEIGRADRRRALRLARRFAAAAQRWGDEAVRGVARRARAHALRGLHHHPRAVRDYRSAMKAFDRAGLPLERARTAIGLLDALMNLGRYEEAVDLARRTREVFVAHGERRRASRLDVNLANLHLRQDRPALALARYRAAERAFARHGDTMDLALTRFNMANLLVEVGRLRDAVPCFESSAELWSARGAESARVNCRLAQAAALARLGRYDQAGRVLEETQQAAERLKEPMLQGMAAAGRARIALDLGRQDAAGPLFDRAIEYFERASRPWEQAEALVLRARWHRRAGRRERAQADLAEAARRFERIRQRSLAAWVNLEELHLLNAPPLAPEVRRRVRTALRTFERAGQGLFEAEARLRLAEDDLARGARGAGLHLARVRTILRRNPDPWIEQRWAMLSARAAPRGLAIDHLERAAAIADLLRARIPTETLRASFSADQAEIAEQAIEMIISRSRVRRAERAFLWSERAHVPRLRVATGAAAAGETRRLEMLAERRAELDRLDARRGSNPRRRAALVSSVQQLYEQLQTESSRDAAQARLGPAEVARLQHGMAEDERLIEYFVGRRAVHAFVVGRRGIEHLRLETGLDRLRETTFRLRRLWDRFALETPEGTERQTALLATERDLLGWLSAALLEPVGRVAGSAGQITIVPHAFLRDVPFHALPPGGETETPRAFRYLLSARERLISRPRVAGEGDLVVGVASPEAPAAEQEAVEVAQRLPGARVLLGDEATRDAFRAHWGGARVIHVASHGVRDVEEPRLSGVGLMKGRWTAFDMLESPTHADLVVLSGCRTGDAVVWGGDEAFGLLPALVQSGARAVLVSLWPVGDEATRSWMRFFYEALASGRSAVRAWTHAAGRIRAEHSSAFYWAPFALYGGRPSSEDLS